MVLTRSKATKILKDKKIRGAELTTKQKRFFKRVKRGKLLKRRRT